MVRHCPSLHKRNPRVALLLVFISNAVSERRLTFGGVQASGTAAMFGVVVDEHVVRHGQDMTIHVDGRGNHHLRTNT